MSEDREKNVVTADCENNVETADCEKNVVTADCEKNVETDKTNSDDEKELAELLEKHKQIDRANNEQLEKELQQLVENAKNNLNIFSTWMSENIKNKNIYEDFRNQFDAEYRSDLFENMCEYFMDSTMVSEDLVFYWKYLIIALLKTSKKYKSYSSELVVDENDKKTNLALVKEKYIFRCFINGEHLCYFKENGNDYYVS